MDTFYSGSFLYNHAALYTADQCGQGGREVFVSASGVCCLSPQSLRHPQGLRWDSQEAMMEVTLQ